MSRWKADSLREIAEFAGRSYTTVRKDWRAAGIVPPVKPADGYDLGEIFQRKLEHDAQNLLRVGSPSADAESELLVAKLQQQVAKLTEEAKRLRRHNKSADGDLLPRDEVESYLTQWAVRFRTPLMRLGDQISGRVPGSQKAAVKSEVEDVVVAALQMVVDMRPATKAVEQMILEEADRIRAKQNGKHNHQDD